MKEYVREVRPAPPADPQVRFDRDEGALLNALAPRPYRSVVTLQPSARLRSPLANLPTVERRSLALYGRIAVKRT